MTLVPSKLVQKSNNHQNIVGVLSYNFQVFCHLLGIHEQYCNFHVWSNGSGRGPTQNHKNLQPVHSY